jgi:hypothetical protein
MIKPYPDLSLPAHTGIQRSLNRPISEGFAANDDFPWLISQFLGIIA